MNPSSTAPSEEATTDINANSSIDLSILKLQNDHCFTDNDSQVNINSCSYLQRMLHALQYYSVLKLNEKSSVNTNELFISFCETAYPHLLSDYQHIISSHDPHLEEINNQLTKSNKYKNCSVSECTLSRRYNSDTIRSSRSRTVLKEDTNATNTANPKLIFYQEIFDGIHHWLWHLYDVGMRMKSDVINGDEENTENNNDEKDHKQNIDHVFGRIADHVRSKREGSRLTSDRFESSDANNKFKLNIAARQSTSDENGGISTIIDCIFDKLEKSAVDRNTLDKFAAFIIAERFDTESINEDVIDHEVKGSNIINYVNNIRFSRHISEFIEDRNVSMFSQGFTWFYWNHHKNNGKRIQIPGNQNNLGGYSEQDLYVPRKYESYKEEILSHLDKASYELVLEKARQYLATKLVKAMRPHVNGYTWLKYDISKDDSVGINHLMALILYCDFTSYCSDFSSTFRKMSLTESIEDVRKRNQLYWHQSKHFREIIECYGTSNRNNKWSLPPGAKAEAGPFYTGIDVVLAVSQFSIRLCSPTSTSKHVEVSLNFSKRSGMIITLDNPESDLIAASCPFINVSWLSRFPDEDERIFTGGLWPIKVKSVRIIDTCRNYQAAFAALYLLDLMIADGAIYDNDTIIPVKLMKQLLGSSRSPASVDPYILSIVKAYIRRKTQIVINLNGIQGIAAVEGFVTEGKIEDVTTTKESWNVESVSSSPLNLISPDIISVFPNATSIIIKTGDQQDAYPFDMFYFATSIKKASNWNTIKIEQQMIGKKNFNKSWIWKLWDLNESELVHHYKEQQLNISFDRYVHFVDDDYSYESFIISRV